MTNDEAPPSTDGEHRDATELDRLGAGMTASGDTRSIAPGDTVTDAPTEQGEDDGTIPESETLPFTRLHPITPFLNSWQVILLMFAMAANFLQNYVIESLRFIRHIFDLSLAQIVLPVAGFFVVLALITAASFIWWRVAGYQLDEDAVRFRKGIVRKQQRQAQLTRVQSVETHQPFLGRIFGLAGLTIEVAGGTDSKVDLRYLKLADAKELRQHIMHAVRVANGEDAQPAHKPEGASVTEETLDEEAAEPFLKVENSTLGSAAAAMGFAWIGGFLLLLTLGAFALVAVLIAEGAVLGFVQELLLGGIAFALGTSLLTMVLPGLVVAWNFFSSWFGYQMWTTPTGFRTKAGLLSTRAATIPIDRVQAVSVIQPWYWRPMGWWSMQMNMAGIGLGNEAMRQMQLLPLGSHADVVAVLQRICPDLGTDHPFSLINEASVGVRATTPLLVPPTKAWCAMPFSWRRSAVVQTDTVTIIRSGWLSRRFSIVPHARVQSTGIRRGLRGSVFGLARVSLHSTLGAVPTDVPWLEPATARAVREQQMRLTLDAIDVETAKKAAER